MLLLSVVIQVAGWLPLSTTSLFMPFGALVMGGSTLHGYLKHRRISRMYACCCPACGYDCQASNDRCPECGKCWQMDSITAEQKP